MRQATGDVCLCGCHAVADWGKGNYNGEVREILGALEAGDWVLDLGSAGGSFESKATAARVVRLDLEAQGADGLPVRGDAARLPFRGGVFAAVISNHSLEHFERLEEALAEIGRVIARGGALFVSVPDASTFTDRLYRWLARGGGHVNPFRSAGELAARIAQATGLPHRGTRVLYSSLSFLNRRNSPGPPPLRLRLLGGGAEWSLAAYNWWSRRLDRWLRTRLSVYGWALYFGEAVHMEDGAEWRNVCLRCGSACPLEAALESRVGRRWGVAAYRCGACGAANPLTPW
mgnify:CR=1 FL=1